MTDIFEEAVLVDHAHVYAIAEKQWQTAASHEGEWRTEWRLVVGDDVLRRKLSEDDYLRRQLGWSGCAAVESRRVDREHGRTWAGPWNLSSLNSDAWQAVWEVGDTSFEQATSLHPIHTLFVERRGFMRQLQQVATDYRRQIRGIERTTESNIQEYCQRPDGLLAKLLKRDRMYAKWKRGEVGATTMQMLRQKCREVEARTITRRHRQLVRLGEMLQQAQEVAAAYDAESVEAADLSVVSPSARTTVFLTPALSD